MHKTIASNAARTSFTQPTPAAPRTTTVPSHLTRITFDVPTAHAPALRNAVDEISQLIGTRLEGPSSYAREQALTDAAICLGALRAAVNKAIPHPDSHYAG